MDDKKLQEIELQRWKNWDWVYLDSDYSDYKSDRKVIAIGGCGRSGTTLLRVILDSHSEIASGPESLLFLPVPLNLPDLAYKFELNLSDLESIEQKCSNRAEFIDEFQELYLTRVQKTFWADKTARNVHRFGYILDRFPQAKVIHVIRDGRDVALSLRTHRKRKVVNGEIQLTNWRIPLTDCIVRWVVAVSDGLKFRGHPNYFEVSYEDLVLETKETLVRVCDFLEINFEEGMMEFHRISRPSRDVLKFPQNIEATKPIFTSSIGRWKESLTTEEIDLVLSFLTPYLKRLGYGL